MNVGETIQQKRLRSSKLFLIVSLIIITIFGIGHLLLANGKGCVIISVPKPQTTVLLDGKKITSTTKPNEEVSITTSSGKHTIITSKKDHQQWEKIFNVQADQKHHTSTFNTELFPTYSMIPEYTLIEGVGIQNDTYQAILALFKDLPTKRVSKSGSTMIEITNNNIKTTWIKNTEKAPFFFCRGSVCSDTFNILPAQKQVRQIDFYPDKEDIVLFSTDDTIWITELNRNEPQNLQKLYTGKSPDFARGPGNTIYIKDSRSLMIIEL